MNQIVTKALERFEALEKKKIIHNSSLEMHYDVPTVSLLSFRAGNFLKESLTIEP